FPFVFPSGQSCRNFDQLALACHNDWTAALNFLRQRDLANFLAGLGRIDLAQAARAAARQPNVDLALDQSLAALPTKALEPVKLLRAHTKTEEAGLVIDCNGRTVTVPVVAELPVKPFPDGVLAGAKTPRQVAEKAKADPKESASLFERGAVAQWYESNGWISP